MKKAVQLKVLVVLALLFAFLAQAVLCVQAKADTVKPEKWVYYYTGDLSGPMGPLNGATIPALKDFCQWYNSEKGGIKGVPIDIVVRDNGGETTKGVAAYEEFRLIKPKPAMGSFHPAYVGEALKDRLAEDKILNFFNTASNPILFPVGWLVGCCPSYPSSVAAMMLWVQKQPQWKDKKIKVGLLTWDNSFGKGIFDPELRKWFKQQKNMELVAEEVFSPKDVDVSTQVIRLKNKGVNWIIDNTIGNGPVVVSKTLNSMGLLATDINDTSPNKIHRATCVWGTGPEVLKIGGPVMEGLIGPRPWVTWDETDHPAVKFVTEQMKKNNRDTRLMSDVYLIKWAKMALITQIVEKIVNEKGWEGVTGENFRRELLNTRKCSVLHGMTVIDFDPNYPMMKSIKVYAVKNGKMLPVSEMHEMPDLRPPQYKK